MRVGWVRTYTGIHISLTNPEPEMISLVDIAHQLSLECRWGGATTRHFSVADHSIWVTRFVRELVPEEHRDAATVHALLHDAHEAYIKDIPTPLKALLGEGYKKMADGLDLAIRQRVGIPAPSTGVSDAIHLADKYASWCEAKALLMECKGVKGGLEPPLNLQQKVPMASEIRRVSTSGAIEQAFLSYLGFAIKQLG